jgi:hypothetical protein
MSKRNHYYVFECGFCFETDDDPDKIVVEKLRKFIKNVEDEYIENRLKYYGSKGYG